MRGETIGSQTMLERLTPFVFVLLWASGFVVARLVRPYAEPETFVSLRLALSGVLLALIAFAAGATWPRGWRGWRDSMVTGALMQGAYVGGVFWAVKHGLPAAVTALIVGLQPLLTAALAGPLLGERVSTRRWLGIFIGFAGAVLVLLPHLAGTQAVPRAAILVSGAGMLAITLGTIWQKRIGATIDLRSAAAVQIVGALCVTIPAIALDGEHAVIVGAPDMWIGLAWGVVVLSVVTTLLLLGLIKRGAVARVTSLFYLTPPLTAVMAFALFGEALSAVQFVGMGVATVGVAVANQRQAHGEAA